MILMVHLSSINYIDDEGIWDNVSDLAKDLI